MTHKDHNHTEKVFEKYCTDMSDYHVLFVQTDTLLLADAAEKVKDTCIAFDPSSFLSATELKTLCHHI